MAITYQQAIEFSNGPIGSQIPYVGRVLRPSNWNNLNNGLKAKYLGEVERAMKDPYGFALEKLQADVSGLVIYSNTRGGLAADEAAERQQNAEKSIQFLQKVKTPTEKIQEAINQGVETGAASVKEQNDRRNDNISVVEKVVDVALSIGIGVATGGLSLSDQIIVNALLSAAQGAKPDDIIRGIVATVGANAITNGIPGIESSKVIPEQIAKVNEAVAKLGPGVVSPTVISGLVNAERQAVAALITKQDVGQNAIAGAVGGIIADLSGLTMKSISPKMSNELSQALSRSVAEYAQYKTAGFTNEQALIKATEGYIDQSLQIESAAKKIEIAEKKEKQLTAGLSEEQVGLSKTYGQGYDQTAAFDAKQAGQFTGTESGANTLPKVTVYGTIDTAAPSDISLIRTAPVGARTTSATDIRELGPITVYGYTDVSAPPEDLSVTSTSKFLTDDTPEQSTQEKTPEQLRRDTILTSLINKKFDRTLTNIPKKQTTTKTKTQGGLGTAALAQALRVGDIGAPIFGRDEEGRRAGWNLQSLRYMGDVGAEND